jgi:tetratricopeptide (TPR) repeat protein
MVNTVSTSPRALVVSISVLAGLWLAAALGGCAGVPQKKVSNEATAHVHEGVAALEHGDLDRAEAEFHLALEFEPRLPHALNGLGLVAMERHDREAARGWFSAAVRANDDFAEGHANLGALAVESGDLEGALPHLASALAIDPGYVPARHNLARALWQLGRLTEARAEYMKLTSTARDDASAWAELAAVELGLGHRAAAGRAAQVALELDGDHPLARRVRGDLMRDRGDLAGARADYDAAIAREPSNADAFIGRGLAFLLGNDIDAARRDLERAAAIAPRSAAAHFALGVALYTDGDDNAALGEFDRALSLAGEVGRPYPQAYYLRGATLARLGQKKAAIQAYEQFLREAEGDATLADAVSDARAQIRTLGQKGR